VLTHSHQVCSLSGYRTQLLCCGNYEGMFFASEDSPQEGGGSLKLAAHGRRLAQGVHHGLSSEGVVDICAWPKVHNSERTQRV